MALFGKNKKEEKETREPKKKAAVEIEKGKKQKPAQAARKRKVEKKEFSGAGRFLRHPIVTEKSTNLAALQNQYVFKVEKAANKNQVKDAIERLYGVKVAGVNIMNVSGKIIKSGRRQTQGFKPGYKKAIVTLAQGEKIEIGV